MKRLIALSLLVGGTTLTACGPPPKVLIADDFMGASKVSKFYIQQSGNVVKKVVLYNLFLRVCDTAPDGAQSNCKDTVVLRDVNPRSVY